MIAVANQNGDLLRLLDVEGENGSFGLHPVFGFIFKNELAERTRRRRSHGIKTTGTWLCELSFSRKNGKLSLEPVSGCEIQQKSDMHWIMNAGSQVFNLMPVDQTQARAGVVPADDEKSSVLGKAILVAAALVIAIPLMLDRGSKTDELVPPIMEPVTVKIEPQVQKAVTVPTDLENPEVKKIVKDDHQVKRAIQQNLGFLGLLGNKNLTKAIGGAPTQVKEASAGAGAGGKEGSGGEYLMGLGEGVKRATVGNTGVAGLGGVGTKGAGGGAGGYGNSMVGSGEGRTLSKVALSQDLILEGGLDRAVIQATIAKYLSQVRACYETGLQSNPGLHGQVNMNFVIAGDGSVSTANVGKTSLGNAQVEGCISTKMMGWQFPKPVGGVNVKVNYPFVLRPVGA